MKRQFLLFIQKKKKINIRILQFSKLLRESNSLKSGKNTNYPVL